MTPKGINDKMMSEHAQVEMHISHIIVCVLINVGKRPVDGDVLDQLKNYSQPTDILLI